MSAGGPHKSPFWNLRLDAYVQGWMLSVLLHGTALGASLVVLGDLTLAPEPEPFKWEVSLVDTSPSQVEQPAMAEPASQPPEPKPPVPQKPAPATPRVEPKIVEPIRQAEPVQKVEPPPQVVEEPPPPKLEQKVEETKPVESIHEAMTDIPRAAEPALPPPPAPARTETKIETKDVTRADTAPPVPAAPPPPVESPKQPAPAPIQEATLRPQPAAPANGKRTDFGWLANALWERVSHLQKYPHLARLRHVEGRVVLRAVITANGHLASAIVAKSSGSELLDEDALATLHKACPLHLAQPLGRQEVVVMIPINYRLN